MNKFVCIHGHFYQPPRENPWLGIIEQQDSAYPHHDWNERITAECYAPNTASRILDSQRHIIDIVNNYSKISFNFGPTLLSYLEQNAPETYRQILAADKESQRYFSGHGSALAQAYNHMIMPLANSRDKRTQVLWGMADFVHRFGRQPEGMWLPETAVDLQTLELLAEFGITFTILAPRQARRFRRLGEDRWQDVSNGGIDPKQTYRITLPSGKIINLFFYDGPISQAVAFERLLESGKTLAARLNSGFSDNGGADQLVHIATDGETYGHHHRFGDMALSYCLNYIEKSKIAQLTIYADYLAKHPPVYEVEIFENSSWSCVHGVERWRANCGCNSGANPGWQQEWRKHLRLAMDWLRDQLIPLYEQAMAKYGLDPWRARDAYINLVLDRSPEKKAQFFQEQTTQPLTNFDQAQVLKLLEMQRGAMLMYTSCGWFFDDLSGIETIKVMLYAAQAIQLAREVAGVDFEPGYLNLLEQAESNQPTLGNGRAIYEKFVRPTILSFLRVAAHYAVLSLFDPQPGVKRHVCYQFFQEKYELVINGGQKLALGRVKILSELTGEEAVVNFAVLHAGGQDISGGLRYQNGQPQEVESWFSEIKKVFAGQGTVGALPLINKYFAEYSYSLWHLFRDEQRIVLDKIVAPDVEMMEKNFRQMFEQHKPVMLAMNELRAPLPRVLHSTAKFVYNIDLRREMEKEVLNLGRLKQIAADVVGWSFKLDRKTLSFAASQQLSKLIDRFFQKPEDINLLAVIDDALKVFSDPPLSLELDFWQAQNLYFSLSRDIYPAMKSKAADNGVASEWLVLFKRLGQALKVRLE